MAKMLNTIEEALEDFRAGKLLIVVDDEDRENEGDFVCAAEKITPEIVNFMVHNGRGVLCAPLPAERCKELEVDMMVGDNTSLLGTPFTVSVDLLGSGCTTGVSAGPWSIRPPVRKIWDGRGISSRSGRRIKVCCGVPDIPKR